jgi:hypothetical protein
MLATELTREALADSIRKRHHYGTTGCRMILDVNVHFEHDADLFATDPSLGKTTSRRTGSAMMGDILRSGDDQLRLRIKAVGSAPIERIDIRNGLHALETYRPYYDIELGRRICVVWEGSEYRGRGRETIWDGSATLTDNAFENVEPINRYNIDRKFEQSESNKLEWSALTTGGHGGFYASLANSDKGRLTIDTNLVKAAIQISDIGYEDIVFDAGGLGRRIRVFRLPDQNIHRSVEIERQIPLVDDRDNAIYIRIIQQDGHVIWSSPIYVLRENN